ncbi:uncharacterized protein LOC116949325 [Petromyzon marinus]|uniref:Uncharacterized protein LOC116949325 isoform X1 n=1 Tax=Petromyzon marinus TaxID=7757 RepID=A0AAJ7TRR2_PETMA|nr:uncharacterized protein LOC116949325 isoform X1 [Petromyzon marinus]XP_032822374.1 uncharacterized protein LOC116949325 isoform X1 [Petromyzon marinus]
MHPGTTMLGNAKWQMAQRLHVSGRGVHAHVRLPPIEPLIGATAASTVPVEKSACGTYSRAGFFRARSLSHSGDRRGTGGRDACSGNEREALLKSKTILDFTKGNGKLLPPRERFQAIAMKTISQKTKCVSDNHDACFHMHINSTSPSISRKMTARKISARSGPSNDEPSGRAPLTTSAATIPAHNSSADLDTLDAARPNGTRVESTGGHGSLTERTDERTATCGADVRARRSVKKPLKSSLKKSFDWKAHSLKSDKGSAKRWGGVAEGQRGRVEGAAEQRPRHTLTERGQCSPCSPARRHLDDATPACRAHGGCRQPGGTRRPRSLRVARGAASAGEASPRADGNSRDRGRLPSGCPSPDKNANGAAGRVLPAARPSRGVRGELVLHESGEFAGVPVPRITMTCATPPPALSVTGDGEFAGQ